MDSNRASKIEQNLFLVGMMIDIVNLGEQFGMYFAQKSLGLDDDQERFIFYIFIAISGASIFKAVAPNRLSELLISVLIELGELFGYLFALPERTVTTMAVSLIFCGIELILHLICFSLALREIFDEKKKDPRTVPELSTSQDEDCCWKLFSKLLMRIVMFIGAVLSPILTLFVDSSSRFRQVFYEILLLLALFFSGQTYDFNVNNISALKDMMKQNKHSNQINSINIIANHQKSIHNAMNPLQKLLSIITMSITFLLNILILPIVWVVLSSLELRDNGENLPSYDRGVYIYLLVTSSFVLLIIFMCLIPCSILFIMKKWTRK